MCDAGFCAVRNASLWIVIFFKTLIAYLRQFVYHLIIARTPEILITEGINSLCNSYSMIITCTKQNKCNRTVFHITWSESEDDEIVIKRLFSKGALNFFLHA